MANRMGVSDKMAAIRQITSSSGRFVRDSLIFDASAFALIIFERTKTQFYVVGMAPFVVTTLDINRSRD